MKVSFPFYKRKSILTTNLDFKNKFLSNIFLKINTVISYSPRSVSWSTGVVGSPHLRWRNDWWVGGWYGCVCFFLGLRASQHFGRSPAEAKEEKKFSREEKEESWGHHRRWGRATGQFFFHFSILLAS